MDINRYLPAMEPCRFPAVWLGISERLRKNHYRIPEKTLLLSALAAGGLGALLGGRSFITRPENGISGWLGFAE